MTTEAARDRALSVLRHAAERAPGNAALWARYVYELRVAGLKARARKAAGAARVAAGQRKMLLDIAEGRSGPVEDIAGMIERGDLAGAWAAGSERLRYFPKDHRLLNLLGVAALSDGDPVRAEPVLRRAVEVEPGNEAARGNLGLALVRQKRAVEAIAVLEEAGSRPGALPAIRVNLASAYQTLRRWDEAERLSAALIRLACWSRCAASRGSRCTIWWPRRWARSRGLRRVLIICATCRCSPAKPRCGWCR